MTKPDFQQEQQKTPQGTPSRTESAKLISEILKRTNQLVQKGDWDRAQGELLSANRAAKELFKKSLFPSPSDEKLITPQPPLASLPLAPMDAMIATISTLKQPENVQPQAIQEIAKAPFEITQVEQTNDRSFEFNCYREALEKAWCDGALTQDEERHLQELQTVLEISDSEHEMFEKEIKCSCYKEALTKQVSEGLVNLSDASSLTELQNIFHVSLEEHLQILHFFRHTEQQKNRDKILLIDDDTQFLDALTISMEDDGFDVAAVQTSDEAYILLQKYSPDLILCDINLKTSTMNGFTLYEKIQAERHLQHIPFIFLTGLTDEKLACTGRELGADDYLVKPISRHSLLSSLHGKLKRFKQLKPFTTGSIPISC
jgi:PleD family two-component response regulator